MTRMKWMVLIVMAAQSVARCAAVGDDRQILEARQAVWRAWFANDTKTMEKLVPDDAIVISSDNEKFKTKADVFREAVEFQAEGSKLVRLEFPYTQMQRFGDVVIIYTKYVLETETAGKRSQSAGRATEIFVLRDGLWVNAGWHTDSRK
jgi:ketosteroid isomerase-like protein